MTDNEIIPISLKCANEYVTAYHRHHTNCYGVQVLHRLAGYRWWIDRCSDLRQTCQSSFR